MEEVRQIWMFNDLYGKLLKPSAAFDNRGRYEKCRQYWNAIDAAEQQGICRLIEAKRQRGEYVDPNPCYAMSDAMQEYEKRQAKVQQKPKREPENYNGRCLKRGVQYVVAKYRGAYGTYSLEDAREFGMERKDGTIFN